jgi:hypothetical protein
MGMVSMAMVKMECEREESWFIMVAPTDRFFLPTCSTAIGLGKIKSRPQTFIKFKTTLQ